MGLLGGAKKKKVPNSRKKKGGVTTEKDTAKPDIKVDAPEQETPIPEPVTVAPLKPTGMSIAERTKAFNTAATASSSPTSAANANNTVDVPKRTWTPTQTPAPVATATSEKEKEPEKEKTKFGLFGKGKGNDVKDKDKDKPTELPVSTTEKEPRKSAFGGLFGKGKSPEEIEPANANDSGAANIDKETPTEKEPRKSGFGGLFGKGKSPEEAEPAKANDSGAANTDKETPTDKEPRKSGFGGLFGKGKSKDETEADTETPQDTESEPVATKKKFGLFGKGKSKDEAEAEPGNESSAEPDSASDSSPSKPGKLSMNALGLKIPGMGNGNGASKPGKLSMNALSLNIPGMGKGNSRGTDLESKNISGKPPPKIDIYAAEVDPESQGHATMSDKAKQTIVGPKETDLSKKDWQFLYELATQFDDYKAQEAAASKNNSSPAKGKSMAAPAPPKPAPGDTKAIKNNLNNLFGGGGGPGGGGNRMNYTANGSFLTNKYFDQYLVEHSSGVALEFSSEISLYKRFNRKDAEQKNISEKFFAVLAKHPKGKKITQLNLSSAILPDAFLIALCACCESGGLPLLQVLNLESNDLGKEGLDALAKCIASPKGMNRLQILKLENQKKEVSALSEEALGEAVVQSQSLVQFGLRLKGGISQQQVANTVQANLDKLRVARRQHAAKKGKLKARKRNEMELMFDTIAANKDKKITEVDLTDNLRFLGLDETERTKTGAAFATNKTVTKITMTKLKLDDDFAEAFGKALVKNKTLETINLESNSFSARGIQSLLEGLGKNTSVTSFQIRHQSKTMASSDEEALPGLIANNATLNKLGTDVRNPLIKSQLERKMNENRDLQRKQRNAQKKK